MSKKKKDRVDALADLKSKVREAIDAAENMSEKYLIEFINWMSREADIRIMAMNEKFNGDY